MPTIDFQWTSTGGSAIVDSQATFLGYSSTGMTPGIAQLSQANKMDRQGTYGSAVIAAFISQILGINVLDDGNLSAHVANFIKALRTPGAPTVVAFSATPAFVANGNNVTFEITLTGNVTGPTIDTLVAGQVLTFIIHQDATGGRTWVNPTGIPLDPISATASKTSIQRFIVDSALVARPLDAMTVS